MLEQYWALKREAGDAILLYRLGDFYEMFFEDAEIAAPLLGLVLTARHKDSDIEAPMCGIPQHALESYLARLVTAGKKVAISEQTEAAAKGRARPWPRSTSRPGTSPFSLYATRARSQNGSSGARRASSSSSRRTASAPRLFSGRSARAGPIRPRSRRSRRSPRAERAPPSS